MKRYMLVAALAALSVSPAIAQNNAVPAAAQTEAAAVTSAQQFTDIAAVSNLFEIESSKIALQKATSPQVKEFAQRMIDDHTKAGDELKAAADAQSIKVPTDLDDKHKQMLDQLNAASGADFDAAYIQMQTDAHHEAVALFDQFSKGGEAGQVKDFAAKTLATLQEHEKAVEALSQTAQAGGAAEGDNPAQNTTLTAPVDQNAMATSPAANAPAAAPPAPAAAQNAAPGAAPADQNAAAPALGAIDVKTLTPVDVGGIKGDDLKGVEVLDPNGNKIASISDFVLTQEGSLDAVIVDFGGFLGIGTKPVAVAFDGLNFVSDQDGKRYLMAAITKEQLDAQPPYNKDDYASNRDAQRLVLSK
ncbi:DUF4142 domain-containing protein [Paradevosia shaoguanensis]|uniref:DUF4142 domain-containing protein n=1 Tax=Paradevosia shaoguanensis TaxID=1335043 RepID=UPI001932D778|nr:DUF4142 domain-containing protein [Paradevosia shaoguanensis]